MPIVLRFVDDDEVEGTVHSAEFSGEPRKEAGPVKGRDGRNSCRTEEDLPRNLAQSL